MNAIERAVKLAGGPSKLAAVLNCSAQAVCFWRDGKRRLPDAVCPAIERATGGAVACEDFRGESAWLRVPDADWPWHPEGRPVIDVTRARAVAEEPINAA